MKSTQESLPEASRVLLSARPVLGSPERMDETREGVVEVCGGKSCCPLPGLGRSTCSGLVGKGEEA